MSQGQSVRKLPGNEKSRIKHQRDREPNSLRQILGNEEQATQNQGTAKHKNHQNKRHNHQTDTAPALSRMFPTVLKERNCAGIECHSLTAPLLRDKAFQPCKDFIVELLSRKGRPHPPVQTDKILLTVSLHAHVPTIQKFSSTYTQMKNKLTGLGPEKRQRRQTKMLHRQSKRNIRAEDTNETISGPKQHFERKQA